MGIDLSRQYIPVTGSSSATLPATPAIRRLRQSGIIFDNAWANPVCSPTRAGLLTGRHSFRTTVANAIPSGPDLPDEETTLPELIFYADYVSGLFGKWHLGDGVSGPNDGPLDQGFDEYRGSIGGDLRAYDDWDKTENGGAPVPVTQYATKANVDDAIDWIQMNQDSKWFAVVAFNAPHTPLHTPTANCDGVADPSVPDINGMIECMDYHIDRLLTVLETSGELEETTVIFVGDNGTDSGPNNLDRYPPFDASDNPSYKKEVYEGGIRVPFIISDGYHLVHGNDAPVSSGIGRINNPGRREDAMVHTVDIFSTVAGIAGVTSAADDSVSMLPYMASWRQIPIPIPQRQYMYTDRCSNQMFQAAIRDSQYKLIYRLDYNSNTLYQELYDVKDLDEMAADDLFGTGIPAEALLLAELDSMWASEGYDPLTGCP
jgi:arylsulfatase A-like enzyme